MNTKHTPGPWSVSRNGRMVLCKPSNDFAFGHVICTMSSGPGKNTVANAEFIARACNSHYDLLAALESALLREDLGDELRAVLQNAVSEAKGAA